MDGWTIQCQQHHCLLGRYSRYEYRMPGGQVTHFPDRIYRGPREERIAREDPVVRAISLPRLRLGETDTEGIDCSAPGEWFDPRMLQSRVGRDLMIMAGSEHSAVLYRDLFGRERCWQEAWHDAVNYPVVWPSIAHPLGAIAMRIPAVYLAGLIWNCLHRTAASARYFERIVALVKSSLYSPWPAAGSRELTDRWPKESRDQWQETFGRLPLPQR
jgi:hypothetical protein